MPQSARRKQIVVFDVNETLLDIEILTPFFAQRLGDSRIMRQWFAELILYSEALTLSGAYTPFAELAVAVLEMAAEIGGGSLTAADLDDFKDLLGRLPAHPDVAPALELLRSAGFRMVTLTNSAPTAGEAVLQKAGIAHFFEKGFSVDAVRRFKPATETYGSVTSSLGLEAHSLRLVAAHSWDTFGATAAGWKAALLARPGNAALRVGPQPDIIEKDLVALAKRIIDIDA